MNAAAAMKPPTTMTNKVIRNGTDEHAFSSFSNTIFLSQIYKEPIH
jgi:hypothetical protein